MIDSANLFSDSNAGEDVISYFSQATEFHAERDIKTEETGALENLYLFQSEPPFGNLPEVKSILETFLRSNIKPSYIGGDVLGERTTETEITGEIESLMRGVKLHEGDDKTKKI